MSEELYYTSAPRGLKPGSRDYCTVARTQSLHPTLADELEGLSGYRILFKPNDPNVVRNPVAWSHLRVQFGGRMVNVLSRICASGLDYTGRTNKFAHHVAMDEGERPAGGPAWLLSQPGFMAATWDGHVRLLPNGRPSPRGDSPQLVARAWQAAAGDAGWAGVLAESFLIDPKRLVYIIFRPGTELLPLFAEAEALLPAENRWEVGFNTFYTNLPPGIGCHWFGIVADSPEVAEARRLGRSLIIDLTQPHKLAGGGVLVEQARTGVAPRAVARSVPPSPPPPPPPLVPGVPRNAAPRRGPSGDVRSTREPWPGTFEIAPAVPPPELRPLPPPLRRAPAVAAPRRTSFWPTALAGGVVGLLLITAGLLVGRTKWDTTDRKSAPTSSPDSIAASTSGDGPAPQRSGGEKIANEAGTRDRIPPNLSNLPKSENKPAVAAPVPEASTVFKDLPPIRSREKERIFPLSDLPANEKLTLSLRGLDDKEMKDSQLKALETPDKLGRKINVKYQPTSVLTEPARVARFWIEGPTVRFAWDQVTRFWIEGPTVRFAWDQELSDIPAKKAEALRDCVLKVSDSGRVVCTILLREPLHLPPLDIGAKEKITKWPEGAPARTLRLDGCRLFVRPGGQDGGPLEEPTSSRDGASQLLTFKNAGAKLTLRVFLKLDGARAFSLGSTFIPSESNTKKEQAGLKKEIEGFKGQIEAEIAAPPMQKTDLNTQARLDQDKLKRDRFDERSKALGNRIKLIKRLRDNCQLQARVVFEVEKQKFDVAIIDDEKVKPK